MELLTLILVFAGLLGILIIANFASRYPLARVATQLLLLGTNALIALNGLAAVAMAMLPAELMADFDMQPVSLPDAFRMMVVSVLIAAAATLPLLAPVRRWLAARRLLAPAYNPDSMLHAIGLIFGVYLVGQSALSFAVVEDMGALAEDIGSIPVVEAALVQALIFYIVAAVGVGLLIRRGPRAALKRLGLEWPAWWHIVLAIGAAVLLLVAQFAVVMLWALLAGESFQEQSEAANALTGAIDTMGMAFLLALTSSTSEEIAFRGAMQPVLGMGLTSVVFAAAHVQYGISPATFFIFVLAIALGIIRARANTTTAILCHFFYNFALMSLAVVAQQSIPFWETVPNPGPDFAPQASLLLHHVVGMLP